MLATAVGQALTKHMHELLDLMFNCGLSEPLVQALSKLAEHIPPLLMTIQGEKVGDRAREWGEQRIWKEVVWEMAAGRY